MGALASRAASRAATTVEEEVTFYRDADISNYTSIARCKGGSTHNGGDGELLLTSILKQLQNVIANDDARLAAQDISSTHDYGF